MGNILKHLCAKEVQILLTRMEERPEDFVRTNLFTVWKRLMDHKDHYTWIERKLIARTKKKITKKYERQRLLARILEETVTPTKNDGEETFYETSLQVRPNAAQMVNDLMTYEQMRTQNALMQMRAQTAMMHQMTNAAANNVSPYQQGPHANPYR